MTDIFIGETTQGFKVEPYTFLSNMQLCKVVIYGIEFHSVENAYQASKCADRNEILRFIDIDPYKAKRLGRTVKVREDFDLVKIGFMKTLLERKFSDMNPHLQELLIATAGIKLVEYNTWRDSFWGVCKGVGENHLGVLLMEVRDNLILTRQNQGNLLLSHTLNTKIK